MTLNEALKIYHMGEATVVKTFQELSETIESQNEKIVALNDKIASL